MSLLKTIHTQYPNRNEMENFSHKFVAIWLLLHATFRLLFCYSHVNLDAWHFGWIKKKIGIIWRVGVFYNGKNIPTLELICFPRGSILIRFYMPSVCNSPTILYVLFYLSWIQADFFSCFTSHHTHTHIQVSHSVKLIT